MINGIDVDSYKLTDSYKLLENEIMLQIKQGNLLKKQAETVVLFAANEYSRYVNNEKSVWDTGKECLKEYPVIFSVIDIIQSNNSIKKNFFIVYKENEEETKSIFSKFNITPQISDIKLNNKIQVCFVLIDINQYNNKDKDVGYEIFKEIERHMIPLDYFHYAWDNKREMYINFYDDKKHIAPSYNLRGVRGKRKDKDDRNSKVGYRKDLDCAFRSSWEANIARILNLLNIKWEYEKNGFHFIKENDIVLKENYLPDFFLDDNTIIEVKGFWDVTSRNRAKLFINQYPQYKYILIDSDIYFMLYKKFQNCIPEWEQDKNIITNKETLQIIGLSFGTRKQTIKTLSIGDSVIFKRDANNIYDTNAILAITNDEKEIGFLSSDWALVYAPKIDIGMKYSAKIKEINQKVINIEVSLENNNDLLLYDIFNK